MMKTNASLLSLAACVSFALAASPLNADELTAAGEGKPDRRAKLAALEGKPAPDLQVSGWVNGKPLKLSDLKGKVVVLDFWATWCGPCIASIPHNNEMAEKYRDEGLLLIGVCHQRGVEKMADTVKDKGMKYASAQDLEGGTVKTYQVDSFPDYYVIDRKGILRVADCQNAKVEEVVQKLLKEE